jgi:hypothetical protein
MHVYVLQREDEKREEEREGEDVEEQREENEKPAHRPLHAAILAQSTRVYMFLLLFEKPFYSISFLCLLWLQSFMIWESQLCHPSIL